MDPIAEIKKLVGTDRLVIGTDLTLKGLKRGTIQKVFLTSNTDARTKEDINNYAELGKVEVIDLEMTNEELGDVCKKSFFISVLGVLK